MTPAQYAAVIKKKGIASYNSKQAVNYRINNGLPLIGVVHVKIIYGRNLLTVNKLGLKAKKPYKKTTKKFVGII